MDAAQTSSQQSSWLRRAAPALTLVFVAPLIAEVLPGATRFSSLFVFPIEMCVWGGGALLIRCAVQRSKLGWPNLVLLAVALALAEECLIQQTSLAPLVIQLKGIEYARAIGINYVYLLWALIYEPVFVVLIPIALVELIYFKQKDARWLSVLGTTVTTVFFLLGSVLAWLTWTRIARPKVFHLPIYVPPAWQLVAAGIAIGALGVRALGGPVQSQLSHSRKPWPAPSAWIPGTLGAVFAILCYGLVLLAFGIAPMFPSSIALGSGLALALVALLILPRWMAGPEWTRLHTFCLIYGTIVGATLIGFLGFLQDLNADFWFKVITNLIAVGLLMVLGMKIHSERTASG